MGIALIALLVFAILFTTLKSSQDLDDLQNQTVISPHQMVEISMLEKRAVEAVLLRQSGNIYRDLGVFGSSESAFAGIEKSFRRAKIEGVKVLRNDSTCFHATRHVLNFRGHREGKKLGGVWVEIV